MTPDEPIAIDWAQQARIDQASEHRYDCRCELCKEWWAAMPPEDEDDAFDEDDPYCVCDLDPTEEETASMTCACCGKEIFP